MRTPEPNHPLEMTPLQMVLVAALPSLQDACREPWIVIGSAAACLSGADVTVADLDILTSRRDVEALIEFWSDRRDDSHLPADGDRFRSRFARFRFP